MLKKCSLAGWICSALVAAAVLAPTTFAAAPEASEIKLAAPLDYQVIQRRTLKEGTVKVAGSCTAECERVEVRLSGKTSTGETHATEWLPAQYDASKKTFQLEVNTPAGGWYTLEVQATKGPAPVATAKIDHVGVGEVFVGAGQSNSTSCGGLGSNSPLDGRTQPTSGLVTTFDGKTWRIADDPQPGAHDKYTSGSFWPAFGDALAAKYKVPIGVAVTGHGGTSIKQWKKGGELFNWTLGRMRQLGPHGFRALLWHQGESDAIGNLPQKTYVTLSQQMIDGWHAETKWDFPVFFAQATYAPPGAAKGNGAEAIRAAQQELWDKKIALAGPDTDSMVGELRDKDGKGIHFSKQGLKVHGEAWAAKVSAWLDSLPENN